MNRFQATLENKKHDVPPVWLMRQAGRYHSHYQALRKEHGFVELCKQHELATEVTMGPIDSFDFDAAILFSDILFPLENMGMPLEFSPGPILGFHLTNLEQYKKLHDLETCLENIETMSFQATALKGIRKNLPKEKGLIGFVGAPFTLYVFATCGSHKNDLTPALEGLTDGRWDAFMKLMGPILLRNMTIQQQAGCDVMAVLDTCAGEVNADDYETFIAPHMNQLISDFRAQNPNAPVMYYSKKTGPSHWKKMESFKPDVFGIDWNQDLVSALKNDTSKWVVQGNYDPEKLRDLSPEEFKNDFKKFLNTIKEQTTPEQRQRWICGLGHGVLPKTPEENVKNFVKIVRDTFQ